MRVLRHRRAPGVENGGEADVGAQVPGIGPRSGPMPRKAVSRLGRDGEHGLG